MNGSKTTFKNSGYGPRKRNIMSNKLTFVVNVVKGSFLSKYKYKKVTVSKWYLNDCDDKGLK